MPTLASKTPAARSRDAGQKQSGSTSSRRKAPHPAALFEGIDRWPSINTIVEDHSRKLLAEHGVTKWRDLGGEEGWDGRLAFGSSCAEARKLVTEVLNRCPGFTLDTDSDTTWAVRLARDAISSPHDHMNWYAHAIHYRGDVRLLDATTRERASSFIRSRLAELDLPGRQWTEDERQERVRLLRYANQLQRASDGERCLRFLHRLAQDSDDELVIRASVVAQVIWSEDRTKWPEHWLKPATEFLCTGRGYQLGLIQFGRHGWSPRVNCETAAISNFWVLGGEEFRISLPPLFDEILETFVRAASPPKTK